MGDQEQLLQMTEHCQILRWGEGVNNSAGARRSSATCCVVHMDLRRLSLEASSS